VRFNVSGSKIGQSIRMKKNATYLTSAKNNFFDIRQE